MDNFDDLFTAQNVGEQNNEEHPFDKEAWVERKRQEREDAYALIDEGTQDIASNCEFFRDYLDVQSHFDRYSVSNAILISHQMPEATRLADFNTWKNSGAYIKKGEDAIIMLEPGKEYVRDDGSKGFSVNVKKVFDISQTSERGRNLADYRDPDARSFIKLLLASSPCKIEASDGLPENVCARYSTEDNKIYIRQGLGGDDIFRSLAQEIAIANFAGRNVERKDCAFTAYCASYMLCQKNGFSVEGFSFERAPEQFKGMELKDVREKLSEIRDTANTISQEMYHQQEKANRTKDDGAR